MPTLNISLTPELATLISDKVTSGMYHSASEVVRAGLRLLKEQDEITRLRRETLIDEIALGTNQLERGESTRYQSGDELAGKIKAEGRRHRESSEGFLQ
jgi:antitoxin ParD1/3/4